MPVDARAVHAPLQEASCRQSELIAVRFDPDARLMIGMRTLGD